MGFERHVIPSADMPLTAMPDNAVMREAAPVVTPLHSAETSRETEILRLAREMRGEWRKERFSRLAGN